MPCCDYSDDEWLRDENVELRSKNQTLTAMLCAVLTAIEKIAEPASVFDRINYEEAGINRVELLTWWAKHKKEDEARRKREKEIAKRELSKTQEELLKLQKKISDLEKRVK